MYLRLLGDHVTNLVIIFTTLPSFYSPPQDTIWLEVQTRIDNAVLLVYAWVLNSGKERVHKTLERHLHISRSYQQESLTSFPRFNNVLEILLANI